MSGQCEAEPLDQNRSTLAFCWPANDFLSGKRCRGLVWHLPNRDVPVHLPPSGWKWDGEVRQAFASLGQQVGDVAPRFDAAAAAGLEDAQSGGVGRRALLGAGAVG